MNNNSLSAETTLSLNLLNMESSLLDQNTVSIIRSPNKQFYYMAALDNKDLEQFCMTTAFRFQDNVLGCNSNETVNGWHHHSSEQVSSDNFTQTPFVEPDDQIQNCSCYPVSSEILAFDAQSDSCPELLATSSETVLQIDGTRNNRVASVEGMSHDQAHIKNNVVNTISMAKLSDACHRSEDYLSSLHKNSRQSPGKCIRKSESFYNNCNNVQKDCGLRLNSDIATTKQYSTEMDSEINSGSVISNSSTVKSCCGQLSSHPAECHHVNIGKNSMSENSDSKGDLESSENEYDLQTSGITSTDHDSAAIDQTWDGYQVPLYVAISDDSTEDKLDATYLQGDWQQLTDEFMDFSDLEGQDSSSCSQHQASELDSDTDAEELLHLIKESSDALRLTRLSLSELKQTDGSIRSSFHREPLATCTTNINCLKDLLCIENQRDWIDVNQLSDLLKQWKNVESEFLRLTSREDLSISCPDVIVDVSPDASPDASPVFQKTNSCSSSKNNSVGSFNQEINMTLLESTSSSSCYFNCGSKSFFNRFDVFSCNIKKLLKDTNPVLQQATLSPIQILFLIILLLITFFYLIAFKNCWIDKMEIKFDPQLRYVIGPPPL